MRLPKINVKPLHNSECKCWYSNTVTFAAVYKWVATPKNAPGAPPVQLHIFQIIWCVAKSVVSSQPNLTDVELTCKERAHALNPHFLPA